MENKNKNPLPDLVGMILAPLTRPPAGADGVRPTSKSKQQTPQRDKQFRGGKNKGL